jgi:hypothetical protein
VHLFSLEPSRSLGQVESNTAVLYARVTRVSLSSSGSPTSPFSCSSSRPPMDLPAYCTRRILRGFETEPSAQRWHMAKRCVVLKRAPLD